MSNPPHLERPPFKPARIEQIKLTDKQAIASIHWGTPFMLKARHPGRRDISIGINIAFSSPDAVRFQ